MKKKQINMKKGTYDSKQHSYEVSIINKHFFHRFLYLLLFNNTESTQRPVINLPPRRSQKILKYLLLQQNGVECAVQSSFWNYIWGAVSLKTFVSIKYAFSRTSGSTGFFSLNSTSGETWKIKFLNENHQPTMIWKRKWFIFQFQFL